MPRSFASIVSSDTSKNVSSLRLEKKRPLSTVTVGAPALS